MGVAYIPRPSLIPALLFKFGIETWRGRSKTWRLFRLPLERPLELQRRQK